MKKDPQAILNRLLVDRITFDTSGTERHSTGTIDPAEAELMKRLIIENRFTTCLETGVAYGASTVAICSALSILESGGEIVKHYGVDPSQIEVFGGAAIAALTECGLDHIFELCEGPSHLMLPRLLDRNVTVDFVFIDGMHTFDYTLLDLFFSDKLLRPGGVLCLHDMHLPSKRKAVNYLMRYRKYVRVPGVKKRLRSRLGAALKQALKLRLDSACANLLTSEAMLVVKKVENTEPPWDFYARI
ncbi:MAG TPA: class I SAM-dependent methyltransferase [Blastocatellia bacterium]|nr:class I SAM-dependent methyltransferase [Blastocatellia bacterium]